MSWFTPLSFCGQALPMATWQHPWLMYEIFQQLSILLISTSACLACSWLFSPWHQSWPLLSANAQVKLFNVIYIYNMWRGLAKPKLNEPKNWSKLRSFVLSLNATISSSKSAKPVQRLSTASKATRKSSWASGQNDNPTVRHFQLIGHSAKLPVVMYCIFTAYIYTYFTHIYSIDGTCCATSTGSKSIQ